MITHITIKNFRSIDHQEIDPNWITVLVGANDAGKSNVLRALNLFFNGVTEPGTPLNFDTDFCNYSKIGKNKAKEIEVSIRFRLPDSYLRKDRPSEIEWTKKWRKGSPEFSTRTYLDGQTFISRSKVPALIDRITFRYIPAIKDRLFFADLQGSLYDVLASVAALPLRASASDFEGQLQDQLSDLLTSLRDSFGADATMKLPENLRQIFEALEINSGGIPLSRRGDGIKIRHIPMILAFVAQKQDQILNRGGVKYTHIWGFEEPENSVEMSACFKMARDLTRTVEENDNYQLFLTTHSPVFYKIEDKGLPEEPWVQTLFVEKVASGTKVHAKDHGQVDETMGLMALVAPFVSDAQSKLSELEADLRIARDLADKKLPTLFIEGGTDLRVIVKAMTLFDPDLASKIHVHDGGAGYGSAASVASRSIAWVLELRHRAGTLRTKALALFDDDPAGQEAKKSLSEDIGRLKLKHSGILEYFVLPPTVAIQNLRTRGLLAPSDLESYYPDDIWAHALNKDWLKQADLTKRLSATLLRKIVNEKADPLDGLSETEKTRFQYTFTDEGKEKVAKFVTSSSDALCRKRLSEFQPLIGKIREELISS